jgi:hypothetical protein
VSEGFKVAMNWGNSQGAKGPSCFVISLAMMGRQGREIKTLGNLQDLRQRISRKGTTEAVGNREQRIDRTYGYGAIPRPYHPD